MLRIRRLQLKIASRFASSASPLSSQAQDHYATLGINRNATTKQVKAAFYELSKKWHPDRANSPDKEAASIKFQAISNAYEVLSNADKRRDYDSRTSSHLRRPIQPTMQTDFSSKTKEWQVSKSRSLYQANAEANRLARWHETAEDFKFENPLKHPKVVGVYRSSKEIIYYSFFAILFFAIIKSSQILNYEEEDTENKRKPVHLMKAGLF